MPTIEAPKELVLDISTATILTHTVDITLDKLLWKLKFIHSEKATKFCEIFPLLLTAVHTVKSKGKISQNFVAFSKYMNFIVGN